MRPGVAALMVAALVCAAGAAAGLRWYQRFMQPELPAVAAPDIASLFVDDTPVQLTVFSGGQFAPWRTTADEVRTSPALWRRMHLAEWNNVEVSLREAALDNMLLKYRDLLANPTTWDRMRTEDWDDVPQPIRTVAYREMAAYWAGFYHLGRRYGLPPATGADTLAAIVMSESWFEHRARFVNRDGSVDMGLGMASDYARRRMRALHEVGMVDATFSDADYLNPWLGTRFAALWLSLLLDESRGDLALAIGAYNRGIANAQDPLALDYLNTVRRRLITFIRNRAAPPAWDYVWRQARQLENVAWPWFDRRAAAARSPRLGAGGSVR